MSASNQQPVNAEPSEPAGIGWSKTAVIQALQCPRTRVPLSRTAYFSRLYDSSIAAEVEHPANIAFDASTVSLPTRVFIGHKQYFVPGSLADLACYDSCVIACLAAIRDAWCTSGTNEDCGPPTLPQLESGSIGRAPWTSYWNELQRRVDSFASCERGWVLNADVSSMASSIDTAVLTQELADCGGDPDAVRILSGMFGAWRSFGFEGLPVTGAFSLLNRFYLLKVERHLRKSGVDFFRVMDDFRLLCRTPEQKEPALMALSEALAMRNLELNQAKTLFHEINDSHVSLSQRLLIFRAKTKQGIVRPILTRGLQWRFLRPLSLALLRLMNRIELSFSREPTT